MSMRNQTKQMFADTMIQLAKKKSIKEIQVKELCAICGADRTTFYYHFQDKYDLVAWIFAQLYVDEESRAKNLNDEQMMVHMFTRIWDKRAFFANALQDHSQNNLSQYILDFYINSEKQVACSYLGMDHLNEEIEYEIKQYSFGCLLHTIDWLLGNNDLTPEKMAHYQFEFMPPILKKAWHQQNNDAQNACG